MITLFSLALLINLLFLTSVIDIHLYRGQSFSVEVHFIFFAISFTKAKKKFKRKNKKSPIKFIFNNYSYIKAAFDRQLSVSQVRLINYDPALIFGKDTDVSRPIGKLLIIGLIKGYLQEKSKDFFSYTSPSLEGKNSFEIIFSFKAFQLFISVLFFLYYKVKGSIGRKEYV